MSTPPAAPQFVIQTGRANRFQLAEAFGSNQTAVRFLENMATDITQTLPGQITVVQETVEANLQMVLMLSMSFVITPGARGALSRFIAEGMAPVGRQPDAGVQMRMESFAPVPQAPCVPAAKFDAPIYLGEGAMRSRIQMEVATFIAQPPGNYQLA